MATFSAGVAILVMVTEDGEAAFDDNKLDGFGAAFFGGFAPDERSGFDKVFIQPATGMPGIPKRDRFGTIDGACAD